MFVRSVTLFLAGAILSWMALTTGWMIADSLIRLVRKLRRRKGKIVRGAFHELLKPGLRDAWYESYNEKPNE
jgi:hypothetical protein